MTENKKSLNDAVLRSLPPAAKGKRYVVWDTYVPGFGVRVTDRGVKSFFVMRRKRGEKSLIRITLGTYPDDGRREDRGRVISEARAQARELLSDLIAGTDPREQKRLDAERAAQVQLAEEEAKKELSLPTFGEAAEEYITCYVTTKRSEKAIAQMIRRELCSKWGNRPIREITRADAVKVIGEIAERSVSGARQVRTYAIGIFKWAMLDKKARGYKVEKNPLDDTSPRLLIGIVKPRDRDLIDEEIRRIWKATDAESPYDIAIRLYMLGYRLSEVANAQRKQFDFANGVWTLKATENKSEKKLRVPIGPLATELFQKLIVRVDEQVKTHNERAKRYVGRTRVVAGPYICSTTAGRRPISGFSKLKAALDKRVKDIDPDHPMEHWTPHDLRRTARTNWSRLGIKTKVSELMMGHLKQGLIAVYDQHKYFNEMREGFLRWEAELKRITDGGTDNVIQFRAVTSPANE